MQCTTLKNKIKLKINIYYDDINEANWFRNLSPLLKGQNYYKINKSISEIKPLLRYDKPDIILALNNEPKLIIEKTSEVPTGHNVPQRFARFANAVEEKVMVIYFLPFKGRKHGKYTNSCNIAGRHLVGLLEMGKIHNTPCIAINWPCDNNSELIRDGSEDDSLQKLITELIRNNFDYKSSKQLIYLKKLMNNELDEIKLSKKRKRTLEIPKSVKIVKTHNYISNLKKQFSSYKELDALSKLFFSNDETLVYCCNMKPDHCRREDPYVGTQFCYDYIWCRNGANPKNKHRNLVLSIPQVSKKRWLEANPNESNRKSSVWYATADMIVLQDGIIICNSKVGP